MSFIADLHIHSRYSMATSSQLTLPYLAQWAAFKGIDVLGTGDFTHPAWFRELAQGLRLDEESGLYVLKEGNGPLFCLQAEISCVYKRHGKTRRVHNLIFMPDLESAAKFTKRLGNIGNVESDGRPILRLDSRDLLEIALEVSDDAVLVPAHIWTPWYSLFGAKSGFDSIEECFGDLSGHIFALETGLSSDPPMNRHVSALDGYAMISSSDAHSGVNLGREANFFSGPPGYRGIFDALRMAASRKLGENCRFLGTLEFYPEEGKYHLDGHRQCGIVRTPKEIQSLGGKCPACGKSLTQGVFSRIGELADRESAPELALEPPTRMIMPLQEVVGQILQSSPSSAKTGKKCHEIREKLGPELPVMGLMDIEEIRAFWEPLGEAVKRVRRREVRIEPGYDGKYGKITIFSAEELARWGRQF